MILKKPQPRLPLKMVLIIIACGHIHQPAMRKVTNAKGSSIYLNSGDWVENLTALEYNDKNGVYTILKGKEFGDADLQEEDELNVELPKWNRFIKILWKLTFNSLHENFICYTRHWKRAYQ